MHDDASFSTTNADSYDAENSAKADFDDLYLAPTPHVYLRAMLANDYCISQRTRPYFAAAVELLRRRNGRAQAVQMLDVGCSYGVGAMTVKFGRSFGDMAAFFADHAPEDYSDCVQATRQWLDAVPPRVDLDVVGLDTSKPALQFARDASLIQGAVDSDLEDEDVLPSDEECALLRRCNLLVSSGAIGYVTAETLSKVLPELGQDRADAFGPLAVVSILRVFDPEPIRLAFEKCDFVFEQVPGVLLPQRKFVGPKEREKTLALLADRDIDPTGLESTGWLYANLFVAAPAGQHVDLKRSMQMVTD